MPERHHTLPAAERFEHHRKAAKELLRAARAGDADALGRLRDAHGEPKLADAQRAIAREHGQASWAAFRRALEREAEEPARAVGRIGPGGPERYDAAAEDLLRALAAGEEPARRRVRAHVARLAAHPERADIGDARLVIARENGFPTWRGLVEGLRRETEAWLRARQHPGRIAAALEAIRAGDAAALARLLDAEPGLVHAEVGAGGSLLGEIAQPEMPRVDRACVALLIERGSELDGPLNLAACFDRVDLVELLLAAGARPERRDVHGITPLETALYHGSRAAADVLAPLGLFPDAPWVAAGAGRVDRLERFLDGCGGLTADAYEDRPNPADVGWLHRLPARRVAQDVLDEALVHAAQNERPAAVAWLLAHGADPGACPYQGCGALHLAAAFGAPESARLLIAAGADVERRNGLNGDNALGWAEYALARERPGDPGVEAVVALLRGLGSRPAVWDA